MSAVKIYQTVKVVKVYEGEEREVEEMMRLDFEAVQHAAGFGEMVIGNQVYAEDYPGQALQVQLNQWERVKAARENAHRANVGCKEFPSVCAAHKALHEEVVKFRELVEDDELVNLVTE